MMRKKKKKGSSHALIWYILNIFMIKDKLWPKPRKLKDDWQKKKNQIWFYVYFFYLLRKFFISFEVKKKLVKMRSI